MTSNPIAGPLERYAQAKNDHDLDAILALCAEDAYYENVPLGAPIHGKPALRQFYTALFQALPDYVGDFDGTAYGPESAVVWGSFRGTTTGQFMGRDVQAGRQLDIPVTFVCTFRDDLLVADCGYFDAATLADQLGVPLDVIRASRIPEAGTTGAGDVAGHGAEDKAEAGAGAGNSFVERFRCVWANPRPERFAELITADAVASWPGTPPIRGADYPSHIAGLLALAPDLRLTVTEHAESGEVQFISWVAQATVGGQSLEWTGIDRFRVRDGRAVQALIAYDTLPLRKAVLRAQTAGSVAS